MQWNIDLTLSNAGVYTKSNMAAAKPEVVIAEVLS